MIGLYASLVIVAMAWGGVSAHSSYVSGMLKQQRDRNEKVNQEISQERSRTLSSQQSKVKYDSFQAWLRQNYSVTQLLNSIFVALPENVLLREFSLNQTAPGKFGMSLKLFPFANGELPSFEGFTAKLENVGIYFENTSQSAADGIQMSCSFDLPERFYPARAPKGHHSAVEDGPMIEGRVR